MANRRDAYTLLLIAALTLIVAGVGLQLGFHSNRTPRTGPPVPKQPDQGPILYDMRSIRSDPGRVRLEWASIPDARKYRVTVLSAADESLFTSPELTSNAWVIPPDQTRRLAAQTVYHWKVTVDLPGSTRVSDPAAFATQ